MVERESHESGLMLDGHKWQCFLKGKGGAKIGGREKKKTSFSSRHPCAVCAKFFT